MCEMHLILISFNNFYTQVYFKTLPISVIYVSYQSTQFKKKTTKKKQQKKTHTHNKPYPEVWPFYYLDLHAIDIIETHAVINMEM
jgi:hypothetical protein